MRCACPALLALASLAVVSCGRDAGVGPPVLRAGRDECAACGMSIYDVRCAAARIVEVRGRRDAQLFDDIGCLLDAERTPGTEPRVVERYVRDYAGAEWVRASDAVFLATDGSGLRTPMGSGIAAFADRAGAEAARARHGGEIVGYDALEALRRARVGERRVAPRGG